MTETIKLLNERKFVPLIIILIGATGLIVTYPLSFSNTGNGVVFAADVGGKNVTSSATALTGTNSSNPLHLISNIRILLNQTLDAVKKQDYAKALDIATTAYLDNFEYVEPPLLKVNKVLKQDTEFMMRGDLRMSLQHHAPLADIRKLVKEININLDQADKLLSKS
ncbi:MAG: hypothetical protein WBZ36_18275 [Candidatus Nitrosopolaris sp.]